MAGKKARSLGKIFKTWRKSRVWRRTKKDRRKLKGHNKKANNETGMLISNWTTKGLEHCWRTFFSQWSLRDWTKFRRGFGLPPKLWIPPVRPSLFSLQTGFWTPVYVRWVSLFIKKNLSIFYLELVWDYFFSFLSFFFFFFFDF